MTEERKPVYPEKTLDDELLKMPHTKARKLKPQPRLKPAHWHWWQARKADVLTITPIKTHKASKQTDKSKTHTHICARARTVHTHTRAPGKGEKGESVICAMMAKTVRYNVTIA